MAITDTHPLNSDHPAPIPDPELELYYQQYIKLEREILELQQQVKERLKKLGLDSLIKILGY